jgi:hypothetical protein
VNSFDYLSVLLSIILGLAITQVLQGLRGLILTRAKVKLYIPTLIWAGLTMPQEHRGFPESRAEPTRGFCFGYLTIIDTACPSLSYRVGKVRDWAQRSAASFILLPLASFFTGLPE